MTFLVSPPIVTLQFYSSEAGKDTLYRPNTINLFCDLIGGLYQRMTCVHEDDMSVDVMT